MYAKVRVATPFSVRGLFLPMFNLFVDAVDHFLASIIDGDAPIDRLGRFFDPELPFLQELVEGHIAPR